jgi:hypothetical protein
MPIPIALLSTGGASRHRAYRALTGAATTHRYAHLDNDPLRRASETIAGQIAAAMEGRSMVEVVPIKGRR